MVAFHRVSPVDFRSPLAFRRRRIGSVTISISPLLGIMSHYDALRKVMPYGMFRGRER